MRSVTLGLVSVVLGACRTPAGEGCETAGYFKVRDCAYNNLTEAVNAAWVEDGIVVVEPSTYVGGWAFGVPANKSVDEVTIEAGGATFEGGTEGPTFAVDGISMRIDDATISGGTGLADADGETSGGGVFADTDATVTLTGCTVSGNTADFGAGIFGTNLVLDGTTVEANTATKAGGGVYLYGSDASVPDATFTNTTVSGNSGFHGGGLYVYSHSLNLDGSQVEGNSADPAQGQGGGVVLYDATLTGGTVAENSAHMGGGVALWAGSTLSGTTVSDNTGSSGAGGVHASPVDTTGAGETIEGATITGNSAPSGGGVVADRVLLTVSASTLSGNNASADGGGAVVISGPLDSVPLTGELVLDDSSVTGNSAGDEGGGIAVVDGALHVGALTVLEGNTAAKGGAIAVTIDSCSSPTVEIASGATLHGNTGSIGAGGAQLTAGTLFSRVGVDWGQGSTENAGGDVVWTGASAAWEDDAPEFACSTTTGGCFEQTKADPDMDGLTFDDCDSTDTCAGLSCD